MKHFNFNLTVNIFIFYLIFSGTAKTQPLCSLNIEESDLAFNNQETLEYAVSYAWGWIFTDVGKAVLNVNKMRDMPTEYRITIDAKTHRFYDKFFNVRDFYEARFGIPDFRSIYFYRNIQEGGYAMQNTYNFDWENGKIDAVIQKKNNPPQNMEIPLKECTLDILTCFYCLRNLNFDNAFPNKAYSLSFALDDMAYNIKCRYLGKENKKIKALKRKVNCLKFAVEVIAGSVFKGDETIIMWISDDKNHIPLELESPITIGKIKVRYTQSENLKYPLNFAN
ncbi:MAG: DUF3108 domain-containing protein [Prevotellaceae bacterium]|jgi:hypothetical protein|nr:DUF3108 domain-containing protein [Prevotellaceae bacterium]